MTLQNIAISELGQITTGDTPPRKTPEYYGNAYPFIKPTDMKIGQRLTTKYEEGYSEQGFHKYENKLIQAGSTAVVTIGSIGKKLTYIHTNCFINQAVNAVTPDKNRFDCLYVYYLLKYNLNLIKQADTGASSGRENVSKSNFSALMVQVCLDLPTQKRIAAILDVFDSLIENNQRRIALLEESARLLYREWFVYLRFPGHETTRITDGVPDGWHVEPLKDVAIVNRASLGSKDKRDDIQYIDISSVGTGVITSTSRMPYAQAPGRARRLVQHGDVIWSCVRPNRRSYALIWTPDDDVIVSTGFAVLTARTVPFTYLYLACTSDDFVSYLANRATGAAYPAVTSKDFEGAPVLRPDAKVLHAFHELCLPLFELQNALGREIALLAQARDALLPKLMTGALAV